MATERNGDPPVPDLRTMEELCQPTLNGRGGPIAPIAIKETDFRLKNDMIQQVQNSCKMPDMTAPSSQALALAPLVRTDEEIVPHIRWVQIEKRPLLLPPPYHQYTSSSFGIQFNMTRKLEATGVSWMNSEFTQSIHTFIDDKRYLSRHTTKKKRATLIVIPSILFTKLIIHHFQKRHKFHPRPDSLLHLPNEEPVLGYLKFSVKGSKREVFGMPIPGKKCTLKNEEASKAKEVLIMEPQATAEDAELQKALEDSMKTAYVAAPHGSLPSVVIREPESRKYQPLLEVPGKGKAKVSEEQSDSEEESEKVMLGAIKGGNDEDQARPDPGAQAEGQTGTDSSTLDEGQAGSNPDGMSECHAGPDPGNAGDEEKSIPSPVVHAGSDREHMILIDKPSDADKSTETEVEAMVNVPIQHAMSSISLMTSPIIDLTSRPESPKEHQQFKATITDSTTTTTTLPPPQAQQQSTTEAMMVKCIGELEDIMANLIQVNKEIEGRLDKDGAHLFMLKQLDIPQQVSIAISEVVTDAVDWAMQAPLRNRFRDLPKAVMKKILQQRMWETKSYKTHIDYKQLFEALEKLMNRDHLEELAQDLAEARKKKKKSRESPKPPPGSPSHQPPPPPLPAGPSGPSRAPGAFGSSQTASSAEYQAWTTNDVRLRPSISLTPTDLEMDEDMGPDEQAQLSDDEDIGQTSGNIWKKNDLLRLNPLGRFDLLLTQTDDMATFIDWFCKRRDLEYLRYGSKGSRPALSISKMKAAYYPDAGLEQMVPD
uniref:Reverse transcriptase domain-containing protein n=1 Tax=Tanacetum cinerariifolium TaxID=118510 RepID=A0A6L2MV44_TANCI|nr:reverse transcriptase domain-containing protein [Tanacetum cinerariifolium]